MALGSFFWNKNINTSPFKLHDSEHRVDRLWQSSRSKTHLLEETLSSSTEKINFSDIGPVEATIKRIQTDESSQEEESDYDFEKNYIKEDESEKSLLSYSDFPTKPYSDEIVDEIVLQVPDMVKPVHGTTNVRPKYISDLTCASLQDSPPKWLCSILPKTVKDQRTIVVGGRPWHDQNVCTWSDDVRSLSPLVNKKVKNRKSPVLHWNNISMAAEKVLNPLVTEIMESSAVHTVVSNINEEDIAHYNPMADNVENESMCILYYAGFDDISNGSIKNIADDKLSVVLERFLSSIPTDGADESTNTPERQKRKMSTDKIFRPSEIYGLSLIDDAAYQIFKLKFSWPDNLVIAEKTDSKMQCDETIKPLVGKYKILRLWPYVGHLAEKIVQDKNMKIEQKISENETLPSLKTDSKLFGSSLLAIPKNVSGSLIMEKKRKSDDKKTTPCSEDEEFELLKHLTPPPHIEDFIFEHTATEVLREDFKFTPYIIQQCADMKSTERKGQFSYILSDLQFLSDDITMLPRKKTMNRIATYATKLYYETKDIFTPTPRCGNSVDYKSGKKFLRIQCNGSGRVFYPNGGVAIDVKNFNSSKVVKCAVKRYVIYGGCGRAKPVLGVFDTLGNGIVYDYSGNIRLNFSQTYGVLFETKTGRPYRWRWHNIKPDLQTEIKVTDAKENLENPQNELEEIYNRRIDLFEKSYDENVEESERKPMHEKENDRKTNSNKENMKMNISHRDSDKMTNSPKENGKNPRLDKENNETSNDGSPSASSPIKKTRKSKSTKKLKYSLETLKPFQLYINKWIKLQIFDQCHISIQFKIKEKSLRLEIGVIIDPKRTIYVEKISDKLEMKQNLVCHFDKFPGRANSLINFLDKVDDGCKIQTAFTNMLPDEGFPDNLPYKFTPIVFSEEPVEYRNGTLDDQCITEMETVQDDVQPIRWKKEKQRVFENISKMKSNNKPFDENKEEKVDKGKKKEKESQKSSKPKKSETQSVKEKVIKKVEEEPKVYDPLESVIGKNNNIVADIRALMDLETPITNILTPKEQIFYKFCQDNLN